MCYEHRWGVETNYKPIRLFAAAAISAAQQKRLSTILATGRILHAGMWIIECCGSVCDRTVERIIIMGMPGSLMVCGDYAGDLEAIAKVLN